MPSSPRTGSAKTGDTVTIRAILAFVTLGLKDLLEWRWGDEMATTRR